jgi:hypothetical protein
MQFAIEKALPILERTPLVVEALLFGLDDEWTGNNEGIDTWSPFDIVAHLIHLEKTDWVPRMQVILGDGNKAFAPFEMDGYKKEGKGKKLTQLLDEFKAIRKDNLLLLQSLHLTDEQLERTGIHAAFGAVTLRDLLATWVAHDLNHIHQMTRVMAKQYEDAVGPWKAYLGVLGGRR